MNNQQESQELTILILYGTMISSICIFLGIVEMGIIQPQSEPSSLPPIHYIGFLFGAASIYLHYKVFTPNSIAEVLVRNIRQDSTIDKDDKEAIKNFFYGQYTVKMILKLALNESVCIFGLVGLILGTASKTDFYIHFSVSLFLMLIMKPAPKRSYKEVEKTLSKVIM